MHPDAQQHGVRPDIQPCSAPASPIGPNPNSSSRCQGASSSGSGGRGGGDELGSPRLLAGDGGFAHWGTGSSGRSSQAPSVTSIEGSHPKGTLAPPGLDVGGLAMDHHRGRASASPPTPRLPAPLAPPPPPPPPPPVLNAAQQGHLRMLQQRERYAQQQQQHQQQQQQQQQQQRGGRGVMGMVLPHHGGGGLQQLVLPSPSRYPLVLPSPARQRIENAPLPSPREPLRQQQHPAMLPLSRLATAMPAGAAPHCPSPVVKVPIYSTLSEAIEHQQKLQQVGAMPLVPPTPPPPPCPSPVVKVPIYRTLSEAIEHQQKQQQQQQQQQPHQSGSTTFIPPTPPPSAGVRGPSFWNAGPGGATAAAASGMIEGPSTPRCFSPRIAVNGSQQQQQRRPRGFNDRAIPVPPGFSRLPQQQQQPSLHGRQGLPAAGRGGGATPVTSGDRADTERASPRRTVGPDNRSLGAPVSIAMPIQGAVGRGSMQAPAAPPSLRLPQMCGGGANTPMSAPPTPVMVYPHTHGYMMAYPPISVQSVQTPRSTRSQAPKAWNPYECVSPSGESTHAGFGGRRGGRESRASSLEGSPVASSRMSVSSRDSLALAKSDGDDDASSQGPRSRASSVVSDAVDRGLHDLDERREDASGGGPLALPKPAAATAAPSLPGLQHGKERGGETGFFKTPSRARGISVSSAGDGDDDGRDKENSFSGAPGGGKAKDGGTGGCERRLSGQKRGGGDAEIATQQTFTGSYFQVSPGSFLQSSKRQRNFA